jgi:hypothetical protein
LGFTAPDINAVLIELSQMIIDDESLHRPYDFEHAPALRL